MFCINKRSPRPHRSPEVGSRDRSRCVYVVVLSHPGVNLTTHKDEEWPSDLATIVVRIPSLLKRSTLNQGESSRVYLYDNPDTGEEPLFLGGVHVQQRQGEGSATLTALEETPIEALYGRVDTFMCSILQRRTRSGQLSFCQSVVLANQSVFL